MNEVVARIEALAKEGCSVDSVRCERAGKGRWTVSIGINDMVPLGEGDDDTITVDRSNLPDGISVFGLERPKDQIVDVRGSEEQMDAIMRDVAKVGESHDMVRIEGDEPSYPHFATKPLRWNRKWTKVDGTWCWASDHKIVLGPDGKARRV